MFLSEKYNSLFLFINYKILYLLYYNLNKKNYEKKC